MDNIHGSAMLLGNFGILIIGKAQSGKSSLVNALIQYGESKNQFAAWIGDDQLEVKIHNNKLIVHPMIKGVAEKSFFGIEKIEYVNSAVIDIVVELIDEKNLERMPETKIYDKSPDIPLIQVPKRNINIAMPLVIAKISEITQNKSNFSLATIKDFANI